jgi:predicted nucleic acid-binding protein
MILLDANILVRLANKIDPSHTRTQSAIFALRAHGNDPTVCGQSLFEFWAVATRYPAQNGLGFDIPHAYRWTDHFASTFNLVPEPDDIYSTWLQLIRTHNVKGFRAHDARYVAFMLIKKIPDFLTYNTRHFSAFPITIIDPTTHPSTF